MSFSRDRVEIKTWVILIHSKGLLTRLTDQPTMGCCWNRLYEFLWQLCHVDKTWLHQKKIERRDTYSPLSDFFAGLTSRSRPLVTMRLAPTRTTTLVGVGWVRLEGVREVGGAPPRSWTKTSGLSRTSAPVASSTSKETRTRTAPTRQMTTSGEVSSSA